MVCKMVGRFGYVANPIGQNGLYIPGLEYVKYCDHWFNGVDGNNGEHNTLCNMESEFVHMFGGNVFEWYNMF